MDASNCVMRNMEIMFKVSSYIIKITHTSEMLPYFSQSVIDWLIPYTVAGSFHEVKISCFFVLKTTEQKFYSQN